MVAKQGLGQNLLKDLIWIWKARKLILVFHVDYTFRSDYLKNSVSMRQDMSFTLA